MKSTNTGEISEKAAKILLESGCVIIRLRIPFRFTSGILSPIYVDNRRLISLPKQRKIIVELLIEKIKQIGLPDVIAAAATAGIPHAAWIAEKLNLPMVYVRSKAKEHGRKNQIEGILKRGQKALVVEDMVSTAQSSTVVIRAMREVGVKVEDEVAIYSHGLADAQRKFKELKVNFTCLTTLQEVVETARKINYLRPIDDVSSILEWSKDPKGWVKKMGFE